MQFISHSHIFRQISKLQLPVCTVWTKYKQPNKHSLDICCVLTRQIPPQSRWILDGFPLEITQAHMLEKALGGSVGDTVISTRKNLAADPNPPKPPPPPAPALDLVVLLDIPDECVTRRAFSHTGNLH